MELIELARGTWSDALQELSRECAGGPAHVHSAGANGSSPSTAPPYSALQRLHYDEGRREVEVSIALERDARPGLRCFVADPQRIFVVSWNDGRALVVFDRSGARTLIQLAAAGLPRGMATAVGDHTGRSSNARAGA